MKNLCRLQKVPRPRLTFNIPIATSFFYCFTYRITQTPYDSANSNSLGSFIPGVYLPERTFSLMSSTIKSFKFWLGDRAIIFIPCLQKLNKGPIRQNLIKRPLVKCDLNQFYSILQILSTEKENIINYAWQWCKNMLKVNHDMLCNIIYGFRLYCLT